MAGIQSKPVCIADFSRFCQCPQYPEMGYESKSQYIEQENRRLDCISRHRIRCFQQDKIQWEYEFRIRKSDAFVTDSTNSRVGVLNMWGRIRIEIDCETGVQISKKKGVPNGIYSAYDKSLSNDGRWNAVIMNEALYVPTKLDQALLVTDAKSQRVLFTNDAQNSRKLLGFVSHAVQAKLDPTSLVSLDRARSSGESRDDLESVPFLLASSTFYIRTGMGTKFSHHRRGL